MHERILDLIHSQNICVLGTSGDNVPHTSLMAYAAAGDGAVFFMATLRNTTKFANILANPSVSLLVDDRTAHPGRDRLETSALTVHGLAAVVENPADREAIADLLRNRLPHLQDFLGSEGIEFLEIRAVTLQLLHGPTSALFERI